MPSRTRTAQALFVLLLLGHIGYQWHGQLAIARNFERSGEKERRQEIVAAWRAEGVEFVFCNKYDECNQYAFVGGNRPVFAPPLHWLIPEKTLEQARQVTHAGFQLDQCPASLDENARFEWAERKWKLRFLKKVQGKCLLIGDAS